MTASASRPLRAVPETAPRALGLIRVSKERDGMMAPEVQQIAITDYASTRGYEITGWIEGIDESGSNARSGWWAKLDTAIEQVEAGRADVIVVWKFSRTARHRLKWAVAIDRVETAGGRIESATEQVDTSTSTGRFTRGMLAELNAFEAERIGEVWKEVQHKRLAEGKTPNGWPRFGYRWVDKQLVPDPETAPVLAQLYRRYVAGESVYALVRWLNAIKVTTTAGRPWSDRSLRRVLDSGFAAGIITWNGQPHPGAHDRLIDDDLWQAYQDARHARRNVPARTQRSQYLLSGLVRCGRCEGTMVANNPYDGRRAPSFRCKTAKEQGPEGCAGGYVAMHVVEDRVFEWLQEYANDLDRARESAALADARRLDHEAEKRRLKNRGAQIETEIQTLTRHLGKELVSPDRYRAAVDALEVELAEVADRVTELGRAVRANAVDRRQMAVDLLATWEERRVEGKRAALSELIDRVVVVTGDRSGVRGVQGGASSAKVDVFEK